LHISNDVQGSNFRHRFLTFVTYTVVAVSCLILPSTARAQESDASAPSNANAAPDTSSSTDDQGAPPPEPKPAPPSANRIFGVLPNYTTVEKTDAIPPISVQQKFKMAELNSFDPYVFPFVGFIAGLGAGEGGTPYARRYAMALADNSIGNYMTTAVMPSLLHQDPRFFQLGQGTFWHRAAYSLTRTIVTRSDSGAKQLNVSELGGNLFAASASNLYYPSADRALSSTLERWGMQVMWDSLSNGMKEFWPDVRRKMHRHA
jgi:hypothetical protein